MEVSYISQINTLKSKSVMNKCEMNGKTKSRAVFSNISNTVSNVDKMTHLKPGKWSEENTISGCFFKSKESCVKELEVDNVIQDDFEAEGLFFSNEVEDDYNDILPKALQLSEETINNLMGFIDSYKENSITLESANFTFLPEPSFDWDKDAREHIHFILEKDFEDVPLP